MLARDPRFDVVDGMDGREFEAFVGQLLGRQGRQVEHIGGIRVKQGVTEWCLRHPARHGGDVFCMAPVAQASPRGVVERAAPRRRCHTFVPLS